MLWIKALHIIAMVTWFAGLFYLPRLFVYHAMSKDKTSIERFKVMERKLYYGIMAPGAFFTIFFGWLLLDGYAWHVYRHAAWLHWKLGLVGLLIIYHGYCGYLRRQFALNRNTHSHVFYRWVNEIPTVILIGCVILAVVKPHF
ncbi:MAG: protoporphyrinogen oxidase HemJ [Pseudomonadota bacterium]|jgi:putative membrane protein